MDADFFLTSTGNDPELDPDREPAPPTKVADKPAPRHGKRDVPTEPPRANPTAARGRGQRLPANEAGK
jgi:plasminogen activator inhibitor 1 RNA-binding protein